MLASPNAAPNIPWYLPSIDWRNDVADYCHRRDGEAATAESLNCSESDQLRHVLTQSAQHRAREKQNDRELQNDFATVQISELSVHRRDDSLRKQIRGNDPREMLESSEIADDCRQCGRHDRGIESGEEHCEYESAERNEDLSVSDCERFGAIESDCICDCHPRSTRGRRRGHLREMRCRVPTIAERLRHCSGRFVR